MIASKEKCKFPERCSHHGKVLAVLTSGGDSQGMNAAIRCVIRVAIYLGCKTYFIREGYQGMIDGGCNIVRANWVSVTAIIHRSGTIIGSARSMEFKERSGRLKAAYNLVQKKINHLVIIGGDGSLTGANLLREEWQSLLDELKSSHKITIEQYCSCRVLNIVGIIGSIDNDFCGSDYTIGVDSALHRISEAACSLFDTADSLKRAFILEVMGRHCGYLAIVSGLILEADYIFCPEMPPPSDWHKDLCKKLEQGRAAGQRLNTIVLSEGAVDMDGNRITAEEVKQVIDETMEFDARITVLGHVQRGGNPSAFDRIMGCRMGADATLAVLEAEPNSEPLVITLQGNIVMRKPLMECINKINDVKKAYEEKKWELVAELRGHMFVSALETFKMFTRLNPDNEAKLCPCKRKKGNVLAIIQIGDPACGVNAAVHSFVRYCCDNGDTVLGISNGLEGLISGLVKPLTWSDVTGWINQGGTILGCKIGLPHCHFDKIAERLREYKINGLLVIGGFEAYHSCVEFYEQREKYPEFRIPIAVIPAAIANNVPGTDVCLGSDTSLNMITMILDCLRQSAQGTKHRVFVIETFGGYCGYLATFGALSSGADVAYIYEEKFAVKDLHMDVQHMASKMKAGVNRGLVLRSEYASENYTTEFITSLYAEEGQQYFSTRMNKLGHTQQGGNPSPRDRMMAIRMASLAFHWFVDKFKSNPSLPETGNNFTDPDSVCVLGFVRKEYVFTPVANLIPKTIFDKRMPRCQWWLKMRPLLKIISKHTSSYKSTVDVPPTDIRCSVN